MTQQHSFELYLNGIIESTDKDTFKAFTNDIEYFILKHPDVENKFLNKISYYKDHKKKWAAKLRETKNTNQLGVKDMLMKTLTLSRRYLDKNEYFTIKPNEIPSSFSLPTKVDQLNLILEKADQFLLKIFPEIESRLDFKGESRQIKTEMIQGNIDWNATILETISTGKSFPTLFTCSIDETTFDLEENILTISCLEHLQKDIVNLLKSPKNDDFDFDEIIKLRKYDHQINNLLERTNLREIREKYYEYSYLPLKSRKFSDLIRKVETRYNQGFIKNKSYKTLVDWIKEYRELNVVTIGDYLPHFPWEHDETIDTMYELWIIFEMLSYFEHEKNVKVLQQIKNSNDEFRGFKLRYDGKKFELLFQHGFPNLPYRAAATPDFVIKINDFYPIVMDPKNYTTGYGDARTKLMSYLHILQTDYGAKVGILFFSTKPDTIHYHDVQCPKCKPTYDYYKEQNDSVYYFHQNINEPNQQDSGTKNKLEKHFEIVFDEIKNQLIN